MFALHNSKIIVKFLSEVFYPIKTDWKVIPKEQNLVGFHRFLLPVLHRFHPVHLRSRE